MYSSSHDFDNLNNWKITFDYKNPISTIKIFGKGLNLEKLNSSKIIFLKNKRNPLLKVIDNYVELYTFPATFSIYYRITESGIMISNVAAELIFVDEEVKINSYVLIQNLCGANYPCDDLFKYIKLCDSSSLYTFNNNGDVFFKSTLKYFKNSRVQDVNNELKKNTEAILNIKKPVVVLISSGYDSRLNLSIALDLQKKYGFKIYLFHEYKNDLEFKIVKKIANELKLYLYCIKRNKFKNEIKNIIFDKKFIIYNSGTYRDNIPRWIYNLNYIKSKIPDALIFGLGVEAHKGKYYRKVLKNDDFKKVFGSDYTVFKLISKYLNIKIDNKFENSFFDKLIEDSKIFPHLHSKTDFIHYHTYCANGYKKRCEIMSKLFNFQFPLIDDKFLSNVFSLQKKEKQDFIIVKNLIKKLSPKLNYIDFYSGNARSLEGKKFNFKSLFRSDLTRSFLYKFKQPKRKGPNYLSNDLLKEIKNDNPKSQITKVLHKFLIKEKYIPVIRVIYALQLYNYFKLLEEEKNVIIKCI